MKPADPTGSEPEAHAPAGGGVPPLISSTIPPPLPSEAGRVGGFRRLLAILLSLCLGLFLSDAIISFANGSLILLFNLHILSLVQATLLVMSVITGLVVYALMGLTMMIPKRLFVPVTLFNPVAALVVISLGIFFYDRIVLIAWLCSLCQGLVGICVLRAVQGGIRLRWPLVRPEYLPAGRFSWLNLSAFLLVNVFVLFPAAILCIAFCGSLALSHFSDGFVTLRPSGLTVQARHYVRDDGKRIHLFPMAHIGDSAFYQRVSESFPTNSIILVEGVSDSQKLLTNKLTYKRAAKTLRLSSQEKEFNPERGKLVRADVDVQEFNTNTIAFLNLVTLFYTRDINMDLITRLLNYSPPPGFEQQLWDDILRYRNEHLLEEIQSRLEESDNVVVPWGAAHMPEIADKIGELGFQQEESRDYVVIGFGTHQKERQTGRKSSSPENPK